MGNRLVQWYNHLCTVEGKGTNAARAMIIAVRAFLASQCDKVRIKRGKIASAKPALGEHEFRKTELAKIYHYADVEGKVYPELSKVEKTEAKVETSAKA